MCVCVCVYVVGWGYSRKKCSEEEPAYGSKGTPRLLHESRVPAPTSKKKMSSRSHFVVAIRPRDTAFTIGMIRRGLASTLLD